MTHRNAATPTPNADDTFPDATSTQVERVVRYQAGQLVHRGVFPRADREDVEQELRLHVLRCAAAFDPSRGTWATFVDRVVTSRAASLAVRQRAARRDTRRLVFAEDVAAARFEDAAACTEDAFDRLPRYEPRVSDAEAAELRRDIEVTLARLAPEDRRLCERLFCRSVGETARLFSRSRSAVYAAIQRLRPTFEAAGLRDYLAAA